MSIHVALHHRTSYRYDRLVTLGPQVVRLRPAPHSRTPVLSYALKVEPSAHFINWQQDPQGNWLARLVFPEPTRNFSVEVDLVADMTVINPFDFFLEPAAETWPFAYDPVLAAELKPFLRTDTPGPLLAGLLDSIPRDPCPTVDFLVAINQRLQRDIRYLIRMEPGVQSPEETLARGEGSCRDTGWLLVQVLRHMGLAARFVSGYLIQLVADQKPLDGPAGPPADFTDLHAWTEVYLPGAGWIGLDPTSGLLAGEGHIPLACTPEPASAAPISGLVDPAEVEFGFDMRVTRFAETPRVTKPYAEAEWQRILDLGERLDSELAAGDVRLTMGGEPTFVSVDDLDGAEWNIAALGPTKRALAGKLIRRLAARFAPGHLLHYGQGKWYPGEQLPRWALTCLWRSDGEPLWRDPSLLAADEDAGEADAATAERFAKALCQRLGLDERRLMPAFEDTWYHTWRERRLPVNIDPHDAKLSDPEERARLARVFEHGLGKPVGHVLPIQHTGWGWQTGPWFFRPERLYLIPGDSPIGFRLPLDSLPWVVESDYPWHVEDDPFEERPPLPPRQRSLPTARPSTRRRGTPLPVPQVPPKVNESAPWVVRTAMAFEARGGILHVFLPPLASGSHFVDLVAAVEDTAAALRTKVMIEGYLPPADPRLSSFSVTPDPGVIEVNIHPAASWGELVERTEAVYAEARATRLGTEKFLIDGRAVGTGGGNHFVVGGPTPADSPFLRRPDLLKSLVGFWQNHPSLSYLFSGLFIGATSQHPRVDEGRADALYELEIAFAQVPRPGGEAPPWLVDRIFRDVLTDMTGNTHRAEFCIDKLYSPDSAGGRRGLVELRAFEMPPHPRMSLAQQLLLRALIAWFWRQPYEVAPVRWGTRLHDEFLLPHYCAADLAQVVEALNAAGYPVERGWFDAHLEFRFPGIGTVMRDGVELELRHALEPWNVLGEEGASGGTVRFVDSSVERLQVKARGLVPGRHLVAVNGVALPLRATEVTDERVAGVRFRAWQPPRALHPTIPVQTPLIFDVYDCWTGRSLGGCTYHVMHPGGRNYDRLPVNANEAEARRRARFQDFGHSPGAAPSPRLLPPGEMPATLDLRRAVRA
ncbi:MAG: transglutaminase family protein [Thalassobaculales bacterium]